MPVINNLKVLSDFLKHEEDNYYSRETVTILSGSGKLAPGTVLAKVTASGKYVPAANTGSDGSQTAVAVLAEYADATSADAKAVVIARDAIVSHAGLTYGASITTANHRATAHGQLNAVGILVREGA